MRPITALSYDNLNRSDRFYPVLESKACKMCLFLTGVKNRHAKSAILKSFASKLASASVGVADPNSRPRRRTIPSLQNTFSRINSSRRDSQTSETSYFVRESDFHRWHSSSQERTPCSRSLTFNFLFRPWFTVCTDISGVLLTHQSAGISGTGNHSAGQTLSHRLPLDCISLCNEARPDFR